MSNISRIDFSQNSNDVNMALFRLQAMRNLNKLTDENFESYICQLQGTQEQRKNAIERIEDMETKWFAPFCEDYCAELRKVGCGKCKGISLRYYEGLYLNEILKDSPFKFKIKDNRYLTADMAERIVSQCCENYPKEYELLIKDTVNLESSLKLFKDVRNLKIRYLGNQVFIRPNVAYKCSYTPKDFLDIINSMKNIENNVNVHWSDTAKALSIYKALYSEIDYGSEKGYDFYGAFISHKTMCEGFAVVFQEMMNRQNIPCRICTSESGGHVFNEVKLNGKWYPIDVSDAAYHKNKMQEKGLDTYAFAGEGFISWLSDDKKDHHRASGCRFMDEKLGDDSLNYLPIEEYNAAIAEIKENPVNLQENSRIRVTSTENIRSNVSADNAGKAVQKNKHSFIQRLCKYVRSGIDKALPPTFNHWAGRITTINDANILAKLRAKFAEDFDEAFDTHLKNKKLHKSLKYVENTVALLTNKRQR